MGVEGSPTAWNRIWTKMRASQAPRMKAFVRGKPKTLNQFWQRAYFDDLMELLKPSKDWKFLELGSGRGTTSLYLASSGFDYITLLDLSEPILEQAIENFQSEQVAAPTTICANALNTNLPSESFDCIYNIGVLEHFENPSDFLKESFRLLRPSGSIFMVIVPDYPFSKSAFCRLLFHPSSLLKTALKRAVGEKHIKKNVDMIRTNFGTSEYASIATSLGFTDAKCVPYNPYHRICADSWYLNKWVLGWYKLHYSFVRCLGRLPSLQTSEHIGSCCLLTAKKP